MGRTMRELSKKVDEAISEVNKELENGWSETQLKDGKLILCQVDWVPIAGTLLEQYRRAGWNVKINVEITNFGREFVFKFTHPDGGDK